MNPTARDGFSQSAFVELSTISLIRIGVRIFKLAPGTFVIGIELQDCLLRKPSRPGGFLPIRPRQVQYNSGDWDWDADLQVGVRYLCDCDWAIELFAV